MQKVVEHAVRQPPHDVVRHVEAGEASRSFREWDLHLTERGGMSKYGEWYPMHSLDFGTGHPRRSLGWSAEDMWGDADTRQAKAVGAYFVESPEVRPQFI